jgi:hypothetical protein
MDPDPTSPHEDDSPSDTPRTSSPETTPPAQGGAPIDRIAGWIDELSYFLLVPLAVAVSIAPYPAGEEPHLVEKLRWLVEGSLTKPLDIFDLFFHASGATLLALKLGRDLAQRLSRDGS